MNNKEEMKFQNMHSANEVSMKKPTSQRSVDTESTRQITEGSISLADIQGESIHSQSQNSVQIFHDPSGLPVRRRPPEREVSIIPYKRMPAMWKLDAKWPPVSKHGTKEKVSNKKVPACGPKSISITNASLSPSSSSETSSLTGNDKTIGQSQPRQRISVKDKIDLYASTINAPFPPSRSEHQLELSKATSPLVSPTDRDESNRKTIGQSLREERRSIKDKINLYENFSHRSSFTCSSDTDFDLQSPMMRLRHTYLGKASQSNEYDDTQEMIASVPLSPNDTLPRPTGRKKHRRISYRIRYGSPDPIGSDDKNVKDNDSVGNDDSKDDTAYIEGGIRGIHGYNRSCKWVSWDESGAPDEKADHKADDTIEKDDVEHTITNEQSAKDDMGCGQSKCYYHPDVWVTPVTSKNGSRLWIAKRVWDMEDRDDEESEYLIEHFLLMDGIRGLMGIPENKGIRPDEWKVNIDESDPWEMSADKDSAPKIPRRRSRSPLYVKRVIDIDGRYKASSHSVLLDQENCHKQLKHSAEYWNPGYNIEEYYSDCDTSFNSIIDCFDRSDDSSDSRSIETENLNCSYQLSLEDEPTIQHENEEFNSTRKTHEESEECRKSHRHNQRGFGRPDEWIRPNDMCEGSSEFRRSISPRLSQTAQKQAMKEPSPEKEYACGTIGGSNALSRRDCETHPEVLYEAHIHIKTGPENEEAHKGRNRKCRMNNKIGKRKSKPRTTTTRKSEICSQVHFQSNDSVNTDCKNEEAQKDKNRKYRKNNEHCKRKSKTHREKSSPRAVVSKSKIEYGSMDEKDQEDTYVRGTPTWEKQTFQQSEEVSDIKLWWE